VRSDVGELFRLRSKRISHEGLGLAATHYDVMTFLCGLFLTGYSLGTVATACDGGQPAGIAHILFTLLVVGFVIFYEMCFDLNRPFDGVYQLRRSGAAMHFLEVKDLVCTHPVLRDRVVFEPMEDDTDEKNDIDACETSSDRRKARIWYN